jgi:hypothetical protein
VNRPFLSRIVYRPDDYTTIRRRLLEQIQARFPGWNPRLADQRAGQDFAIVLADACAYLSDVLGFYQDCRANEAFVRTAVLPGSIADLTALVNYVPDPGVAASALEVFTLIAGKSGTLPAGFAIETAPKGQQPALIFETTQPLAADALRNTLRIAGYDRSQARLNAPGAAPSTGVLLDAGYGGLKAGSFVVLTVGAIGGPVRLTGVTEESGKRRLHWNSGAIAAGANIPIADLVILGNPKHVMTLSGRAEADELPAGQNMAGVISGGIFQNGTVALLVSRSLKEPVRIVSNVGNVVSWNRGILTAVRRSESSLYYGEPVGFRTKKIVKGLLSIKLKQVTNPIQPGNVAVLPGDQLLIEDAAGVERVLVAGMMNAKRIRLAEPTPRSFKKTTKDGQQGIFFSRVRIAAEDASEPTRSRSLAPVRLPANQTSFVLDRSYDGLAAGSAVVLSDGEHARARLLTAVEVDSEGRTVLTVATAPGVALKHAATEVYGPFANQMRVNGFDRNDSLEPAGQTALTLSGSGLGVSPGDYLVIEGGGNTESLQALTLEPQGGDTRVTLQRALENEYPLATTVIYGNVAPVTHGARVKQEILGSGDQSLANQQFVLKQAPVTRVPDSAGIRGARSTLDVFVGDDRWDPVESLAESGPDDRHYMVETDAAGSTTVRFGDGHHGAKPATGRDNIKATYRVGLGQSGNVLAGTIGGIPNALNLVESATNPMPSAGGTDRDTPEVMRRVSRFSVRTLGRAVSLADYADLALAFSGIAKARAVFAREARRRVVQLTVAAAGGGPLSTELAEALQAYLDDRRAPEYPLVIQDFEPVPIRLAVQVLAEPNTLRGALLKRITDALGTAEANGQRGFFHFDARDLGEDLHLSRIYALLEQVPGAAHSLVTDFRRESDPAEVRVLDRVTISPNGLATGGDPLDPTSGFLGVDVQGGLA